MRSGNISNFRRGIMLLGKVLLTAILFAVFAAVYFRYYCFFSFRGHLVALGLHVFLFVLLLQIYGGYKIGMLRIRELSFSGVVAAVIADAVMYFVLSLIRLQLLNPLPMCVAFVIQMLLLPLVYTGCHRVYMRVYPPVRTIAVCLDTPEDLAALDRFTHGRTNFDVQKVLHTQSFEEIEAAAAAYDALIVGNIDRTLREKLMDARFKSGGQMLIIPTMQDIMLNCAGQFMSGDSLVYACKNQGFTPEELAIKRATDVLVSCLGLILSSPITLLTALAVKLYDGGPVFYKQKRLTRNHREFMLIKFRSMVVDAEKLTGAVRAGKRDARITPVGRFIRASRIDELPQLWNILKGDMSLVGPRPERPELFDEICRELPQFAYRLKVKAGLSGYAQLYGKYNTTFEDKLRMDMYYIQNASLMLDLQLLFYTFKIIFMKESTEGVE